MNDLNEVLAQAMVTAYNQGVSTTQERIIQDLQNDAVISTGMPVEWLRRVVEIVEGKD